MRQTDPPGAKSSTQSPMRPNYSLFKARWLIVLSLLCAAQWQPSHSHGFLLQPMSRSFVSYMYDPPDTRDYNPQGTNAGGKQVVYDGGRLQWPNGRFGLCGEPWNKPYKRYEQPGRITATYAPGSTISIHVLIASNHWGRFAFSVCPHGVTAADYQARCTPLQREDGKGPHWTLPPGELPDPQGRPLVPAYHDASFSYYIYPENDDFRDTPVYVLRFKLPPGLACDSCFLHWNWLTGNSCNPPCEASDPLYPDCNRLHMGYCGEPKALQPEEFWGCSDIRIGAPPKHGPVINSSLDALADRLRDTHQREVQDREGKPQPPQRPAAEYWRADLLEAAERLDEEASKAHRGPGGSRRGGHSHHHEQPLVAQDGDTGVADP